jgi:serine/threonine protein kinase
MLGAGLASPGSIPSSAARYLPGPGDDKKHVFFRSRSSEDKKRGRRRKCIGEYEVIQFLGKGSQGFVLKGQHQATGEVVAIKTILGASQIAQQVKQARRRPRVGSASSAGGGDSTHGGAETEVGAEGDEPSAHGGGSGMALGNLLPSRRRKRAAAAAAATGRGGGPLGGGNSASRQVMHEIALLKKARHPNIVRLLSVIDLPSDKDIHLVFEFVNGGPLRQLSDHLLLSGSGLPLLEDEARVYMRQLASALRYLHFHGIVHRDIKPSNLIIDRGAQVLKLTDLGIAMQTSTSKANKVLGNDDDLIATTMLVGTPAFLPAEYYKIRFNEETMLLCAEQREGEGEGTASAGAGADDVAAGTPRPEEDANLPLRQFFPGRAADVWAAGATLYAFIYGMLPHLQAPRKHSSLSHRFKSGASSSSSSGYGSPTHEGGAAYNGSDPQFLGISAGALPALIERVSSTNSRREGGSAELTIDELQWRIIHNALRFPGTGLGTSAKLRNLLSRMLDKDPRRRIRIEEVCQHEWLTANEAMPNMLQEQMTSIEPSAVDQAAAVWSPDGLLLTLKRHLRHLRSKLHVWSFRTSSRSFKEQERQNSFNEAREAARHEDELFEQDADVARAQRKPAS